MKREFSVAFNFIQNKSGKISKLMKDLLGLPYFPCSPLNSPIKNQVKCVRMVMNPLWLEFGHMHVFVVDRKPCRQEQSTVQTTTEPNCAIFLRHLTTRRSSGPKICEKLYLFPDAALTSSLFGIYNSGCLSSLLFERLMSVQRFRVQDAGRNSLYATRPPVSSSTFYTVAEN